ncbi:MAG: LysE family translocator [Bdellovibrio sp.]|nr:LysE family translocator [Bdellovibrio sp.]
MSAELYLSFIFASALVIAAPGPTSLFLMAQGARHGHRRAMLSIIGTLTAHLLFIFLASIGITSILKSSVVVFTWLKWFGAGYLIYMGVKSFLQNSGNVQIENHPSYSKESFRTLFRQGFWVTFSNPKAILCYTSFFPPFMDPHAPLTEQYFLLGSTFMAILALYSWATAYAMDKLGRKCTWAKKISHPKVTGTMMIGAGAVLASTD